ncbi:hypothetical protein RO3G_13106 [Rhizopus delemar RA 99-880]|uniref:Reverse transcriptase zinc-binding domain-containing protein n=1 Tax=Rhizopus delemar (strain RA 99-880 / ATCC MYA-4621 / FGSC 9543 / NRRL 43880) TaxID=246409 RepID=I1CIW5_RHIO9|nr:hypothetical protein RO3G_13106 [Rhizopus delemar RA 99-880]|eukprot:EIE88395.1 hypothetical protein RO3G_13106 [Rhizopus delemar RA 99-880]
MAPVLLRQSDRPALLEYLPGIQSTNDTSPPPVKHLSYADDLEDFLTHPSEWPVFIELLTIYGRASNAKVNLNKTVLVSLSGVGHSSWISLATQQGITWHDRSSHTSVRYLGYPLYHTAAQHDSFLQGLLLKIRRRSSILRERHLSIRVRITTSTRAKAVVRELFPSSGQADATIRLIGTSSLPVASTLHWRNVTSCASPVCRICHNDIEDTFHFVVGCQLKWQSWCSVLALFRLTDQFPDAASVWSTLATLSSPDNRYTVCSDHIRPLGFAFPSLWKLHWRCVLNGTL